MGLALGLGLGVGRKSWDAGALALFSRGTFSSARKAQINARFKAAGMALSKLDFWHMFNGESESQALLNWVSGSFAVTKVGSPAFTAGRGYKGDGATTSLNTNMTPSTAGGKFTLNDASMGVLFLEPPSAQVQTEMNSQGTSNNFIGNNGASAGFATISASANITVPQSVWQGLITLVRRSASQVEVFCGKLSLGTFSSASTNLSNAAMHYLSRSNEAASFSVRTVSAGFAGGALSAAEVEALDATIRADMIATGGYLKRKSATCLGNSLTDGTGASDQATTSYPAQLQGLYNAIDNSTAVINRGITSRKTVEITSDLDTVNAHRIASQYPADKRIAIIWEIRNDLATPLTGVQAIDNLEACCIKARTHGYDRILVGNMIATGYPGTTEQQRTDANNALAARWPNFADGMINLAADPRLSNANDLTYYTDDKLHLNDTGYGVVASIMKAAADATFASIGA